MNESSLQLPARGRRGKGRLAAHEQIQRHLVRRIGRVWPSGSRLPSLRDLSAELGTGYVSTHRAVRSLVDRGLLVSHGKSGIFVTDAAGRFTELVREAQDLYADDAVSKPLAGLTIDVLASQAIDAGDEIVGRMFEGFKSVLADDGVMFRHRIFEHASRTKPLRLEGDGAVWLQTAMHVFRESSRVPLVTVGTSRAALIHPPENFDVVCPDEAQGIHLAADAVRSSGLGPVGFVGCCYDWKLPQEQWKLDALSTSRLHVFEEGLGAPVLPDHTFCSPNYDVEGGVRAAAQFLAMSSRPKAIFAASDDLAIGFIYGTMSAGLEPGRDYTIIGFDGQEAGRRLRGGPLVTVGVPAFELGRRGGELLRRRMLGQAGTPETAILGCTLLSGTTFPLAHTSSVGN